MDGRTAPRTAAMDTFRLGAGVCGGGVGEGRRYEDWNTRARASVSRKYIYIDGKMFEITCKILCWSRESEVCLSRWKSISGSLVIFEWFAEFISHAYDGLK